MTGSLPQAPKPAAVTGCILAGGLGRRLGNRDKGLLELHGRALVAHVIERFAPQVDNLLLSVNRNQARYHAYCSQLVGDDTADSGGPLAGIAAALAHTTTPWLAVVPCDSPFLPRRLVATLMQGLAHAPAEIAVARTADGLQPLFAVIATHLAPSLVAYIAQGGRKVAAWYGQHAVAEVDYDHERRSFMNINTLADLTIAAQR